ncbi:hypothetical protein [Micromonospora sp. SH-82]|uniref:hypothetical protein n=1 Tax=Micromonospora sp. SH-82 TaxID=3132938 RepID=UPI003EB75BE2
MPTPPSRPRFGALALAVAGVLFALYPATRPWHDESTVDGATRAMTSGWWVASHLFAMIGFVLVTLGLLAVRDVVRHTRAERLAFAAVVTGWIGVGLVLPYYGAETFGLHAIATTSAAGQPVDLLDLVDTVRYHPVPVTTFGIGLLAFGVSAILTAVAVWRSGVLSRAGGVGFALGFALFLPQFYTPAAIRVAHGLIVAVGSVWLAVALWRGEVAARPGGEPPA